MISGQMRKSGEPESVIARLSNVEFFHVGQAFKLGRYPIHFHMNGNMSSSYVSQCAIHESFNRATNIHASNYLTIENNVIYNVMGGAYFLEDGIEIGNIFKYNLAVFVKTSSSLLSEDVTPGLLNTKSKTFRVSIIQNDHQILFYDFLFCRGVWADSIKALINDANFD